MMREQTSLVKEQLALELDPTLQKIHRGGICPADGESRHYDGLTMRQYKQEVVRNALAQHQAERSTDSSSIKEDTVLRGE